MTANFNEKTVVHLFLPKTTPDKCEDDIEEIEEDMLMFVAESFQKVLDITDFVRLAPVQVMLDKWISVQPKGQANQNLTVQTINKELRSLQVGSTIPIYIRKQNSTMVISKLEFESEEKVRVQTFRSSLPSEAVMSNVDSLKMNFPETSNIIENVGMLKSKIFAIHLYEMATETFALSMGYIEKGGSSFSKSRDVPQPFLISDWAVGVLVPRDDVRSPQIAKKVRDQVTMATQNSREFTPFRRSGMWMSIKVVLHMKILEAFGGDVDTAKVVYKLIIIHILATACKKYKSKKPKFDMGLARQMLAKVGRRVRKLQGLTCGKCDKAISTQVEEFRSTILHHTFKLITVLYKHVQFLWNHDVASSESGNSTQIFRSIEEFKNDLIHNIDPLDKIVTRMRESIEKPASVGMTDIDVIKTKSIRSMQKLKRSRFYTMASIVQGAGNIMTYEEDQLRIWLHDTEQFIKGINERPNFSSKEIFDLGQCYITKAREVYKDNPLGVSQMLLVSLKLTSILDKIALLKHPILKDYQPSISTARFDCLLLPYQHDVDLLNELVDYFNFRDSKGFRPILERRVDAYSLCARYAESNYEMVSLKVQIQSKIDRAIQQKMEEVENVREKCRDLERQMKNEGGSCSCEYEWIEKEYWDKEAEELRTKTVRRKVHSCNYCPLACKLRNMRKSVTKYEVPFPPASQGHFQNAVVFEFLIPEEVSLLRQFLAVLKYELLGEDVFNGEGNGVNKNWLEYKGLSGYSSKTIDIIRMGSTVMPSSCTYHCSRNWNPDVLLESNERFIINNGMNCHFHYAQHREPITNAAEICSFHLGKTANPGAYLNLQGYLVSTDHSQNDVLANQCDRDHALSLEEYVTFGSLRAGHRLQLRNLYKAISGRYLSLEKEPVLALILQTLWQVGPRGKDGLRENHLDFTEDEFAEEFLELLEKLVKSNEFNYSIPLVLLAAIFITAKIMDMNENCRGRCYQLFKEWRELATTWCTKIEHEQRNKTNATVETNDVTTGILHEIHMCAMMTYNMSNVSKSNQDIVYLLHTISRKNLLAKESNPRTSNFMDILKLVEKMTPVRFQLDKLITPGKKPKGQGFIDKFIEKKCPATKPFKEYEITKVSDNIIVIEYSGDYCITFDIFTGELLINGNPEMELSSQINSNIEFQRFFQKHFNFRVQRLSANILRTIDSVYGKHYEFRTHTSETSELSQIMQAYMDAWYGIGFSSKNDLAIIELQDDLPHLFLVPHRTFHGFIRDHFIDNYTHWLDPLKESVYLRRIKVDENDSDLSHEYVMTRTSIGWVFQETGSSKQFLMSIKSTGWKLLTDALDRIESPEQIDGFMNHNMSVVGAILPRHNLRFNLKSNGLLESLEYPGFEVCMAQYSLGTLMGLKNSLLMKCRTKRSIIIPHGKIKMHFGDNAIHQVCDIDFHTLSQPPFYIYELDEVLKRIKAKKSISSWLYLAALHAATSSCRPDKFTGVTGTEMAVNILQSAKVWSCSPYDKESLEILKFIKSLSPKRNYYGHTMIHQKRNVKESIETIDWPMGIPPMAAYDGYAILVNKLLKDSIRLETLHPMKSNCVKLYKEMLEENDFSEKLLLRGYLRNVDKYNDGVKLNEDFFKELERKFKKRDFSLTIRAEQEELSLQSMLSTAYMCHFMSNSSFAPLALSSIQLEENSLFPFLITNEPLHVGTEEKIGLTLANLFSLEFRPNWLKFYSLAISPVVDNYKFSVLLCALTYHKRAPIEQIRILHCIRTIVKLGKGDFPSVPTLPAVVRDPMRSDYIESEIVEILKQHCYSFQKYDVDDSEFANFEEYKVAENAHNVAIAGDCDRIAKQCKTELWPREVSDVNIDKVCVMLKDTKICFTASLEVNKRIRIWFNARKLRLFVESVQEALNTCIDIALSYGRTPFQVPTLKTTFCIVRPQKCETHSIQLADCFDQNESDDDIAKETHEIYKTGSFKGCDPKRKNKDWIRNSKLACELKIEGIEKAIKRNISRNVELQILDKSGLIPRLNPVSLLKTLPIPDWDPKYTVPLYYVGALGVLWAHLKRFNRCLHIQPFGLHADLEREVQNPGHENWSPMDRPEWLLLELELDIMIRKVQVEVAEQMREMPVEKNGVMQLNMGEGKTSVIVPMLCSILAKEDSLCRVTVLSSIFKMNWGILKFAIGGLLNRRLYSFPCRRNMTKIDLCLNDIQETYKECLKMKGVVLTLPEYRLSFRSLAYDKILRKETEVGINLLKIEDWLRWYARDILDESDELLSVKYQLVYTIGDQIQVDGGDVRWLVCQQILGIIEDIAPKLLSKYGLSLIEYDFKKKNLSPHEFASFRLLAVKENEHFSEKVEQLVTKQYLASLTLHETQKELVTEFLLEKEISQKSHSLVIDLLKRDAVLHDKILTLAGYIHRGVLRLALSKRWRVEYGVDPKGLRRMAVPFRAKDVAAERTEFGHPDLAIILSHLSYYYSGLCDSELEEVFSTLAKKNGPEAIYKDWIDQIPAKLVPDSLTDYDCLNLKDKFQKACLFDLIRRHKMVINFWLSQNVFPKESMQFPEKLVMTAADLVYERQRLPITGFSGTNDSIVLLPLNINQQDLPHLQVTNERMEQTLLQPENSGHKGLAVGATCDNILQQMKQDKLRVLIDSGALMLELDNEQVAQRWLEIDSKLEAAVYFNKDNELMVKLRDIQIVSDVPFELSPFQGKLEYCGVFLDDQHTRGTDLKFPDGSKACVTIGSRMKREKLLQACMRMRKLGNGHSIAFYLSHEANNSVTKGHNDALSTYSILEWVKENTKEFNNDGLLFWAITSKNYAQRLAAEDIFHFPAWENPIKMENYDVDKAIILAKQCVDDDVIKLMDMYGQHSQFELMKDLIREWFKIALEKLVKLNRPSSPPKEVLSKFDKIYKAVRCRCRKNVPKKRILSSCTAMDEHQEKELEHEKEVEVQQERQVEKPAKCTSAKSFLHPNVVQAVVYGGPFQIIDGIKRLCDIFEKTSFYDEVQPDCWSVEVYVTSDFISVTAPSPFGHYTTNSFLRPMEYFVSTSHKEPGLTVQILFLSPYEANELMSLIRNHRTKCPLHMFATRRFKDQNMLLNIPRVQLPPAVIDPSIGKFRVLESGALEMAALLVASGSLYFDDDDEQRSYARFLSLEPKPWNKKLRTLFGSRMIKPSGFLVQEYRQKHNFARLGFKEDPVALVRKILKCRHSVVSDTSHVVRLLEEKTYVKLRNQGNKDGLEIDAKISKK